MPETLNLPLSRTVVSPDLSVDKPNQNGSQRSLISVYVKNYDPEKYSALHHWEMNARLLPGCVSISIPLVQHRAIHRVVNCDGSSVRFPTREGQVVLLAILDETARELWSQAIQGVAMKLTHKPFMTIPQVFFNEMNGEKTVSLDIHMGWLTEEIGLQFPRANPLLP